MFMMEKAYALIIGKSVAYNIDYEANVGKYYMHNDTPWEYLWAKSRNDVIEPQKELLKESESCHKGHQTILEFTLPKIGRRGLDSVNLAKLACKGICF